MTTKQTYTIIPDWLAIRKEIGGDAKLIYCRLARHGSKSGVICADQATLARELGIPLRTVSRQIQILEKKQSDAHESGLIKVIQRGRRISNLYQIVENHPWKKEWLAQSQADNAGEVAQEQTPVSDASEAIEDQAQIEVATADAPSLEPAPETIESPAVDFANANANVDVAEVFEYCMSVTGRSDKLDSAASAAIKRALGEHSKAVLMSVADAAAKSRWHQGENKTGRRFDHPAYIFKDAQTIEILLNSAANAPASSRTASPGAGVVKTGKLSSLEASRADNKNFLRALYPHADENMLDQWMGQYSKNSWGTREELNCAGNTYDGVVERVIN